MLLGPDGHSKAYWSLRNATRPYWSVHKMQLWLTNHLRDANTACSSLYNIVVCLQDAIRACWSLYKILLWSMSCHLKTKDRMGGSCSRFLFLQHNRSSLRSSFPNPYCIIWNRGHQRHSFAITFSHLSYNSY